MSAAAALEGPPEALLVHPATRQPPPSRPLQPWERSFPHKGHIRLHLGFAWNMTKGGEVRWQAENRSICKFVNPSGFDFWFKKKKEKKPTLLLFSKQYFFKRKIFAWKHTLDSKQIMLPELIKYVIWGAL